MKLYTKYSPREFPEPTGNWFVLDPRHPWRKIRQIAGIPISTEKRAYVQWKSGFDTINTKIIGQTAFPTIESAIANQNFRCHQLIMKCGKNPGLHFHLKKRACEIRLLENIKTMRKNYASK